MEWNEEPSITIPDESFTVKEILERFTTGMPLSLSKQPIYDSEASFDDIDETRDPAFDLADATLARDLMNAEFTTKKEAAKAAKAAKEADEKRNAEEADKAAAAAKGGEPSK